MKYIFFDLDGTIADSAGLFVDIFNNTASTFGIKRKLTLSEFRNISIEDLIQELKIPKLLVPILLIMLRYRFRKKSINVKIFPNILEPLEELKTEFKLGIITSNSKTFLNTVLKNNNIGHLFEHCFANSGLFNKNIRLNKFIKKNNLSKEDVVLVTDEGRDIASSNKLGIRNIAVTWGFDNENVLKRYNFKYIAHNPLDLVKTCKTINNRDTIVKVRT